MPKVVIAEDEFMNLDMIAEVLADSGYDVATLRGRCRKGSNSASGISPTLPPSIHTLLIAAQGEKGLGSILAIGVE
jgi:CheY-like chemotaxis protein